MGYTFDERMAVLGPHVHDGVPLLQAASAAGVPLRTAQRWLTAYLTQGAIGLRRSGRADKDRHRLPDELLEVIEGMALRRPPPHAAEVHRAADCSGRCGRWLISTRGRLTEVGCLFRGNVNP